MSLIDTRLGHAVRTRTTFLVGLAILGTGLALQLADLWRGRHTGFRMAAMEMATHTTVGMALTAIGVLIAGAHLLAHRPANAPHIPTQRGSRTGRVRRARLVLLAVSATALVIDTLKPVTIGFVLPGMRAEYGLTPAQLALLPLITITGAVIGSVLWGVLTDRIGRRRPLMIANLLFAATAVCATMPSYAWNIAMCFLMGMSAGGMLPTVITLLTECLPTRMRGPAVVMVLAVGSAVGYLLASGLAAWLLPTGSWRLLWAMGLPTAIILALLARFFPESPRYLARQHQTAEAHAIASRYDPYLAAHTTELEAATSTPARVVPLRSALTLLGLGIGLVNWGLVMFLPLLLQTRMSPAAVGNLLLTAAVLSVPVAIGGAWAYARLSSKWSVVGAAGSLVAALALLAILGVSSDRSILVTVLAALLAATGALAAMFNTYAAETSSTATRGFGAGLAAGSFKLGGLAGPGMFAIGIAGLAPISLAIALPLAAGGLLVAAIGTETRDRQLEAIGTGTPARQVAASAKVAT